MEEISYEEQIEKWFEEHQYLNNQEAWEEIQDEVQPFSTENRQLAAIQFIVSKLNDKSADFLHGEHNIVLFNNLDEFQQLTEEDIKMMCILGVDFGGDHDRFSIYASL